MKELLLCFMVVLSMQNLDAQNISHDVFPNGAGYTKAKNTSISFTIGQAVTATLGNENNIITQGFQQPEESVTVNTITPEYSGSYSVYPIPSSGLFTVDIEAEDQISGTLEIRNTQGKLIEFRRINTALKSVTQFNFEQQNSGLYLVRFIGKNNEILFTQKISIQQ